MPHEASLPPTTVLVVEDDPVLRADFVRILGGLPGLTLLGDCGTWQAARRQLLDGPGPDLLLVDLGLPDGDGVDLIELLRRQRPQARALVISVFADEGRVVRALAAGAQGYLLKDATQQEIARAVGDVREGSVPLSPRVARYLLRQFAPPREKPAAVSGERLSPREAEILTLVANGHSAPEVAQRLGLSLHTVYTHLRNCHAKLAARNRMQAIARARDSGQIG